MTNLAPWQSRQLIYAPDLDMSIADGRAILRKSLQQEARRKRTTSNVFATLSGRTVPRQGFLSVEMMRAIYLRSELVRACVDTLIEFISALDWTIRPIDEDKSKWMRDRDPDKFLDQQKRIEWLKEFFRRPSSKEDYETFQRKLLRDLLIYDAGAYEVVFATMGDRRLPLELGVMAGETIEIETDDQGIPDRYHQSYNVQKNVEFESDEIAYMMLNPCTWQPYGISPIETAYISIAQDLSANKFNLDYFNKNGIPPGLLAVIGVSAPEFRNIMAQMRKTSEDNPHNLLTTRAQRSPDGSAQKVFEYVPLNSQSNRDMQFAELMQLSVNRVSMAYKLNASQIGFTAEATGGIGSGIAETQESLAQNKAIAPLMRRVETTHTFNVIHRGCGWTDLEFAYVESNTPQEEQEYQKDMQEMQSGALTVNEFRGKRSRKPVEWGDLPMVQVPGWQPPMTAQQMQQQQMAQMQQQPPQDQGQAIAPQQPVQPMEKSAKRIIIDL
jgi:phage portal protein BeeE